MSRLTIRAQITLLAGLLGVLLVCATAGMAMFLAVKRERMVAQDKLEALALDVARSLDLGMSERYREIRGLADLDTNRDFWIVDTRHARSVLDALQRSLPEYAWIGIARPDGVIQSATQGVFEGVNVSDRPWFRNGRQGPFVGDVHEGARLADVPHNDPKIYRDVNITVPIRDKSGDLIGVIGARLNWNWAAELRTRLVDPDLAKQSTRIWFLEKDGSLLLGPDSESSPFLPGRVNEMLRHPSGGILDTSSGETTLEGYALAQGFRDFPGLGWIVIARQPAQVAFAIARARIAKTATIGGSVALLGLILFALIGGRLAKPIAILTEKADQIGRDPNADMLPRLSGSREVELLSGALRSLLRRLGDAEERTAASEELRAAEGRLYDQNVDQLRQLADTDPLTGLPNRRSFESNATAAMEHFRRNGRPFAMLVIDIDHFKRVNDAYGHAVGDEVIRRVASLLRESVRVPDRVARVGGEEFVALLHEIGPAETLALAERIRRSVSESYISRDELVIRVTVSVGAALVQASDRDIEDVVSRADAGLYKAKAAGRNRCILQAAEEPAIDDIRAA